MVKSVYWLSYTLYDREILTYFLVRYFVFHIVCTGFGALSGIKRREPYLHSSICLPFSLKTLPLPLLLPLHLLVSLTLHGTFLCNLYII